MFRVSLRLDQRNQTRKIVCSVTPTTRDWSIPCLGRPLNNVRSLVALALRTIAFATTRSAPRPASTIAGAAARRSAAMAGSGKRCGGTSCRAIPIARPKGATRGRPRLITSSPGVAVAPIIHRTSKACATIATAARRRLKTAGGDRIGQGGAIVTHGRSGTGEVSRSFFPLYSPGIFCF